MSSEPEITPLTPEEQALRHRQVRQSIWLRAAFIGVILAAWWILFVPDTMMESQLKVALGLIVGLVAAGSYLFNLRQTLRARPKPSRPLE